MGTAACIMCSVAADDLWFIWALLHPVPMTFVGPGLCSQNSHTVCPTLCCLPEQPQVYSGSLQHWCMIMAPAKQGAGNACCSLWHLCISLLSAGTICKDPGHQEVMHEMLRQAEMQGHKQDRRLVWLDALKPVFAVSMLLKRHAFCAHPTPKSTDVKG